MNESYKNAVKQSPKLQGLKLIQSSYNELPLNSDNCLIYCDPPYQNTTKYATDFDHNLFWEWCRELSKQGHSVWVSEYNAPSDFKCVWGKKATSQLSANGKIGGSKISTEKLFRYCG